MSDKYILFGQSNTEPSGINTDFKDTLDLFCIKVRLAQKDILIKKLINELELISEVYLEGIVNKFDCDFTDEEIQELIRIRDSK